MSSLSPKHDKTVLESSTSALTTRALLGVQRIRDISRESLETPEDVSTKSRRFSPKPGISKYGQTKHFESFSTSSVETLLSSSSQPSPTSSSPCPRHLRSIISQQDESSLKDDVFESILDANTSGTSLLNKSLASQNIQIHSTDFALSFNLRRVRKINQSEMRSDDQRIMHINEVANQRRRTDSNPDAQLVSPEIPESRNDINQDRGRNRNRRRHQAEVNKPEVSFEPPKECPKFDGSKYYSCEDSGIVDCEMILKVAETDYREDTESFKNEVTLKRATAVVRKRGRRTRTRGGQSPEEEQKMLQGILLDWEDSGVHLDEPTSPATDRWTSHVTSPVRSQWTEEELDAFVRQLSNPQHEVTRSNSRDPTSSPNMRKCSLDLCHELKDRDRVRAPLARSETDTSASFGELDSPILERVETNIIDKELSGDSSLISGMSGLRLIKNKKMVRSSHANAKRYVTQKHRDEHNAAPATLLQDMDTNGMAEAAAPIRDVTGYSVTFSCNSSPDGSEGEVGDERRLSGQGSNGAVKAPGKKRRFRKMLTRPLNRSQSAGCAKDVPAHALFLEQQQKKSKEEELNAARKARASEGDIRSARRGGKDDFEEEGSANNNKNNVGRIHKTKSADSAMMATDEFGAISQPKSKSRNIAKKITRKMQFLRRRHTDSTLGIVGKDDGARRLASVDPEEVLEWGRSFESLLFDKTGLELFRGFLLSEHSDENIEFWIACENYKTIRSNKQLPSLALKIFNDYVAVQSKREINLDSKTRTLTYESVTSNPTRQTFDEAQKRVQALMEKDSYRRFLESEIYQDLAAGNIQHKS